MIQELQPEQVRHHLNNVMAAKIYFVGTPLCGTCKLARRMLTIACAARPESTVYECNLNLNPELAQVWQITSVPGLFLAKGHCVEDRLYAFSSVDHVYQTLQAWQSGPPR